MHMHAVYKISWPDCWELRFSRFCLIGRETRSPADRRHRHWRNSLWSITHIAQDPMRFRASTNICLYHLPWATRTKDHIWHALTMGSASSRSRQSWNRPPIFKCRHYTCQIVAQGSVSINTFTLFASHFTSPSSELLDVAKSHRMIFANSSCHR